MDDILLAISDTVKVAKTQKKCFASRKLASTFWFPFKCSEAKCDIFLVDVGQVPDFTQQYAAWIQDHTRKRRLKETQWPSGLFFRKQHTETLCSGRCHVRLWSFRFAPDLRNFTILALWCSFTKARRWKNTPKTSNTCGHMLGKPWAFVFDVFVHRSFMKFLW